MSNKSTFLKALLVLFLTNSCVAIDAKKLVAVEYPSPTSLKNLNLELEVINDRSGLLYDVVVDDDHLNPTVIVHASVNESPLQIENRINNMSYDRQNLNNLADAAFFRQNTEYQTKHNGVQIKKTYQTPYFGGKVYALSLGSNISYLANKLGIKKYSNDKKEGCLVKIVPEYNSGYNRISCSVTTVTSIFTLYLTPYYCITSYKASANLIRNSDKKILTSYDSEENINRISWLFLPLTKEKIERLVNLNKADHEVQRKISKSILSKTLETASTFEECKKDQPSLIKKK